MDVDENFFNNDNLFEKKFLFEKKPDWILPSAVEQWTSENVWTIDSLLALKKELNATKSLLNDKGQEWHEHTSNINKASYVLDSIRGKIHPELLTQAWCKFYEILSSFPLISAKSNISSLHLCEAPGGFISALNYYLCLNHSLINWSWMANTLNPYYEGHCIRNTVVDDRLLLPTLKHWYFGENNTGDITESSFINDICKAVEETGLFDLVTADGSVDCLDNPAEQETIVGKLHFCELIVTLSCLAPNGNFVLKKFTFFECTTLCQLYLLNCVFEQVNVFKPFTSRHSNSEVYVVCLGFTGSEALSGILQQYKDIYSTTSTVGIFPLPEIPESFLQQVEECMKYFTDLQMKSIKENLSLYPLKDELVIEKLNSVKEACAEAFLQKYHIFSSTLYDSCKLITKKVLTSFSNKFTVDMKSLYFYAVGDTFNNILKSSSMQWYDKLTDVEKRIDACFPTSRKRPSEKLEWQSSWKEVRKRMKSKKFDNWISFGRRVTCIQNSKFCDPLLLYLWNRVSLENMVDVQFHMNSKCNWYSNDSLEFCVEDSHAVAIRNIVVVSSSQKDVENDSLLLYLKQNLNYSVAWYLNLTGADSNENITAENKVVYINATVWVPTLHNECAIKETLTEVLLVALETLKTGDMLLLCIQSILTRYTAGLIFLLISLFDKFTTVLPETSSSACSGQLWIFKNYQIYRWNNNVRQYLKTIKQNILNSSEEKDVLEIVPMSSLCDASFFNYLKNLNNKHLLQRLKNLTKIEKSKIEKSL